MERAAFENLEIYRLAEKLADEVWRLTCKWSIFARDTVGKQLVRAADSIGANIAEGYGRGSHQDNHRFVRISRGSLNETRHWLRRAYNRELLRAGEISPLKEMLDELGPRLNAYLASIDRSGKKTTPTRRRGGAPVPTTPNKQPPTNNKHRANN